jgi:Caspase domain/Putative peptidoglycan binding domain
MLGSKRAVFTRTLRRGDSGEDVRQLQELLRAAGYDPGPADGKFGPSTHAAVVAFQRSQGLEPDGAVGPLTRAALAQAAMDAETPPGGGRTGLSLHIGLNRVNNQAYGFNVPDLAGCVNDANDMRDLAQAQGFRTRQLLDSAGTSTAIIAAVQEAARTLQSGDIFWISYSGHGSQVPDPSEPDQRSETWVLYDRQLIDNELYALWSLFRPGVRVLVVSDSCHSGTVTREIQRLNTELSQATAQALGGAPSATLPTALAVRLTLDLVAATSKMLQSAGHPAPTAAPTVVGGALTPLVAPDGATRSVVMPEQPRLLPLADAEFDAARRAGLYREVVAAAAGAPEPQCKVLLLSGCQDNQTSSDGRPDPSGHQNGAFTKLLRQEWAAAGNYADLHARIVAQMPSTQTPNLFWATPRDIAFEAQRPFTI